MKPVPSKLFLWQKLVAIDVQIWLKTKSIGLVPCLLHVIWYDIDLPPRSAEIKGPETIACSDCWKISSQNTLCFCKPLVINAIWKSCVPSLQNKSAVRTQLMIIVTWFEMRIMITGAMRSTPKGLPPPALCQRHGAVAVFERFRDKLCLKSAVCDAKNNIADASLSRKWDKLWGCM